MSLNRDNPKNSTEFFGREYIPVTIRISMEESPFWGRATAISPDRIEFLSQFEFRKGRVLVLGFELDGEKLEEIRGAVAEVLRDPCGYFHYTLTLSDRNQQKTILEKLQTLTAKTC